MNRFFILIAILIMLPFNAKASNSFGKWYADGSPYGVNSLYISPEQCASALAEGLNSAKPLASWAVVIAGYEDSNHVQLVATPNNNYNYDPFNLYCSRSQAQCGSGLSKFAWRTTVASFDAQNRLVPSTSGPNPECVDGCTVQQNSASSSAISCVGYINQGTPRVVGSAILAVCTDSTIRQTGASCNYDGADQQGVSPASEQTPADVLDNPQASTGGSAGGLDATDKANLQAIASSTSASKISIESMSAALQGKLSATESANVFRQSETMGALNSMRDALNSIDAKTGNGSGSGNAGGDGFQGTGGIGDLGAIEPIAVPDGGLKSPGESALSDFKSSLSAAPLRDAGTCPTWTLDVDYFSRSYVFDQHCTLFNNNRGVLEAVMVVSWTLSALAIVLRA